MTVIELAEVTKTYGSVGALDRVDLRIESGELVALLGPNGAGKTTTFELLLGLIQPTTGRVQVFDGEPGSRDVMVRLGAMLQGAGLPESITVAELVRLIGRSYPRAYPVEAVLDRVGLTDRRDRTVTDLSGGERQRLLLATAIVGAPDVLLLDEPTAGMDVAAKRAFWAEARGAVADGTTLLFATHDLAEADAVAERVVVLRGGRVLADATPAELKQQAHGKVARFVTDAAVATLSALPGGGPVEVESTTGSAASPSRRRVRVHTTAPEELVAALVAGGHRVDDFTATDAGLEDAFVHLTSADPEPTDATSGGL
jgi:ABC-2 type transport system ATP-binding protein